MTETEFVYVTYISTTPQRLWDSLIRTEFTRQYWGHENVSDWKTGSLWEHREAEGGKVRLVGRVVEFDPPRRLVLTWADPAQAKDEAAHTRVTFELEPIGNMVRLTVTHDRLVPGSDMHRGIANGWPRVLSSLKSFLETGRPLDTWAKPGAAAEVRIASAGDVVSRFYEAAQRKDLAACRTFLGDDLVFVGLFETYPNPSAYLAAFTGLLGITKRIDVKTIIAEGDQAAIFFDLETTGPVDATTFVAEWHRVRNGKIVRVQSAFDGRPFAAMFSGKK